MRRILRRITSALIAAASFSPYWALLLVCLALLLGRPALGQTDQQVSFRLSRIETSIRTLQSQIDQLDRQLGRQQRLGGSAIAEAAPTDLPAADPAPNFDQLATLVIETRQDVFALQDRLTELEAQLTP